MYKVSSTTENFFFSLFQSPRKCGRPWNRMQTLCAYFPALKTGTEWQQQIARPRLGGRLKVEVGAIHQWLWGAICGTDWQMSPAFVIRTHVSQSRRLMSPFTTRLFVTQVFIPAVPLALCYPRWQDHEPSPQTSSIGGQPMRDRRGWRTVSVESWCGCLHCCSRD